MPALGKTDDSQRAAGGEGPGDPPAPLPRGCGEKGEGDEIESDGRIARGEGAIAPALIARDEGGREFLVAAESRDLRRARASPMVLEDCVDGEARPQGEGEKKKHRGAAIEPQHGTPCDQRREQQQDENDDESRDGVVEVVMGNAERRPVAEEEAGAGTIEPSARPEIDAREQHRAAAKKEKGAAESENTPDHDAILGRRRRISAAARAVSSGGS